MMMIIIRLRQNSTIPKCMVYLKLRRKYGVEYIAIALALEQYEVGHMQMPLY